MKNNIQETIITTGLIAIALLLLNPFHFWMPDTMVMGILAAALIIFGVFASFIIREKAFDERDDAHRALAGRNAFLTGSALLMLGIIFEGHTHQVDAWLVISLIGMILAKTISRLWSDKNL